MALAREAKLRSAQLKMLRTILSRRRILIPAGDIESWVEWIQLVTNEVRQLMENQNIPGWVEEQRERLQRWHTLGTDEPGTLE